MRAANDVCRSPLTGAGAMQNADDRSTSTVDSARRSAEFCKIGVINESLLSCPQRGQIGRLTPSERSRLHQFRSTIVSFLLCFTIFPCLLFSSPDLIGLAFLTARETVINRDVRGTTFSSPLMARVPQFKRYSRRHKEPGSSYVIARPATARPRRFLLSGTTARIDPRTFVRAVAVLAARQRRAKNGRAREDAN